MKCYAKYYFDGVGTLTLGEDDGKLTDLHFASSGTHPGGVPAVRRIFHRRT